MHPARYSTVAVVLHWAIAIAVIAMVPMGWWMSDAITDPDQQQLAYQVFQLHKSIGFTILALTLCRVVWRMAHRIPPLPAAMAPWERFAARATHAAFYALLIFLPVTGWAYVSTGWSVGFDRPLNVATSWFGLFPIPHLPGLAEGAEETRRLGATSAMAAHSLLAWGAVVLTALHVGAALKHQFMDRDGVLASMAPWLRRPSEAPGVPARHMGATLAGIVAVLALGMGAGMLATPEPGAPAATAAAPDSVPAAPAAPAAAGAITPGRAPAWTVDAAASSIGFTGAHAGKAFKGRFEEWDGHIWFDPADLAGSKAVIVVRTASARTGDATQEGSLTDAEWFNPKAFPQARFEASSFRALGADRYEAVGTLQIKARSIPVTLPFTLAVTGDVAKVSGALELDRTALDLGMFSDPSADWVSRQIGVTIEVAARRTP